MIDWTTILTAILALFSGSGLTYFLFYPQMKRAKELENDQKAIEQWKELYNVSNEDSKQKSNFNDKLYDDLKYSRHENNDLKAQITALQIFECTCINCDKRKPPLGSNVKTVRNSKHKKSENNEEA